MTLTIERSKNNLGQASDEKEAERSPATTSEVAGANLNVEEEKEEAQTAASTATPERPNLRTRYLMAPNAFQCCGSGSGSVCVLGLLDPDPDPWVRGTDPYPDPSAVSSSNSKQTLDSYCIVTSF
jgi:hypothetical protein